MKNQVLVFVALSWGASSCSKQEMSHPLTDDGFVEYKIARSDHYSDRSTQASFEQQELRFSVRFDSSAIYTTADPDNQYDINKLYGFSDNNAHHHQFSARIGWRWSDGALRLFAYTYNKAQVAYEELTTIPVGVVQDCSIRVSGDLYVFSVNGNTWSMPRQSTTIMAKGYKLFPYFGGDESAPQDIRIWIKEY